MNPRQVYGALVLATIFLGGCATVPVPQLTRPESSGLGIVLTLQAPVAIFTAKPDVIYFARVDNEDGLLQQAIFPSNYAKDDRFYLLNLRPGTYVAVAAFFARAGASPAPARPGLSVSAPGRTGYTTFFSKEFVEHTRVKVTEKDFAFMGSYVTDQSVGLGGADPVQIHYASVISPGAAQSGFLGSLLSGDFNYRGTALEAKKDEDSRSAFFTNARKDLAESDWAERIK